MLKINLKIKVFNKKNKIIHLKLKRTNKKLR